jgi:putative ATP-dependent endonuclease of OLD family
LRRINPECIRHRLDPEKLVTQVNEIQLPVDDDDAAKFVRQAVLAQPEIYFASLVILGEGDSEEIVVPRIAKALGVDLDPSFVAFAPLRGRHVNHFWRLMNKLEFPFLTLLDFDLGRYGAGPLRLNYAYDELNKIADIEVPDWINGDPSDGAYWKQRGKGGIRLWRRWLAGKGVFFSYPLDLDLMMVRAFPEAYGVDQAKTPKDTDALEKSVFGKGTGLAVYEHKVPKVDHPAVEELVIYDSLFKKRDKPGSHLKALVMLSDETLRDNCPPPLSDLIKAANGIVRGSFATIEAPD